MNKLPRMSPRTAAFCSQLANATPLMVLTGAGISTGCGIPTYRDERGVWLRSKPITHQEFVTDSRQRQRYWGRSTLGWATVSGAHPSQAHRALAALEAVGHITQVVTQNVDRLHQRAGTRNVIDLHGRLDRVHCLDCEQSLQRSTLQPRLLSLNPWLSRPVSELRPDGDADLAESDVAQVVIPDCTTCGGTLMPDVVFFGGSIPKERIAKAERALQRSNALLVVGSSLQVYSGYRFCRWAKSQDKPIFIVNPGITRADEMAHALLSDGADTALTALHHYLTLAPRRRSGTEIS